MMKYKSTHLAKIVGTAALACFIAAAHASTPKLIKRVPPEFPREAVQASVDSGVVRAKMAIDADGKVTEVTIVESQPRRVFDRAVQRALMDWRFEASGSAQTHEVRLVFRNDE
jgi:protein TonB